jgi:hypothetical protein
MISELEHCEQLARLYPRFFRLQKLSEVEAATGPEPIYRFDLCDTERIEPSAPVFGLFAGVHGIEAIGVKILLSFLDHILEQTSWNAAVRDLLARVRVTGIPIVNPFGFVAASRCNGNGVDLMRNAPVDSTEPTRLPLVNGHRISPRLPYFRGEQGLELENLQVIRLVEEVLWASPFSYALDIHSGFGSEDFLWTPYARKKGVPPRWVDYQKISSLLDRTLPNHVYRFEPQSVHYCTHGDLWDYLFDWSVHGFPLGQTTGGTVVRQVRHFLPMTLEVGSWIWLKKSPSKAFSIRNFFNPVHPHRERRVLRRHLPLLNFLLHVVADYATVLSVPCSDPLAS